MFAKAKSADDVRPCAIIKVMAPVRPHGVCTIIAAVTRPM